MASGVLEGGEGGRGPTVFLCNNLASCVTALVQSAGGESSVYLGCCCNVGPCSRTSGRCGGVVLRARKGERLVIDLSVKGPYVYV